MKRRKLTVLTNAPFHSEEEVPFIASPKEAVSTQVPHKSFSSSLLSQESEGESLLNTSDSPSISPCAAVTEKKSTEDVGVNTQLTMGEMAQQQKLFEKH